MQKTKLYGFEFDASIISQIDTAKAKALFRTEKHAYNYALAVWGSAGLGSYIKIVEVKP